VTDCVAIKRQLGEFPWRIKALGVVAYARAGREMSEEDCAVYGQWPPRDREVMRTLIDRIPLREPVCEECRMAFWRNILIEAEPEAPEEPPHRIH